MPIPKPCWPPGDVLGISGTSVRELEKLAKIRMEKC